MEFDTDIDFCWLELSQLIELSTGELVCLWFNSDVTINYKAATSFCASLGSFLASVKTLPKLRVIQTLVGETKAWVGIDDLVREGTHVWASDGEVLTAQQKQNVFNAGEPNDSGGEDCVEFSPKGRKLNDIPCYLKRKLICEKNSTRPTTT